MTLGSVCFWHASPYAADGFVHRGVIERGPGVTLIRADRPKRTKAAAMVLVAARAYQKFRVKSSKWNAASPGKHDPIAPISQCDMIRFALRRLLNESERERRRAWLAGGNPCPKHKPRMSPMVPSWGLV